MHFALMSPWMNRAVGKKWLRTHQSTAHSEAAFSSLSWSHGSLHRAKEQGRECKSCSWCMFPTSPLLRACPWSSLSPFMLGKSLKESRSPLLGMGLAEAAHMAESNPHFSKCTESSHLCSPGLSERNRISRQGISLFFFLFERLSDFSCCHF